jgi:hypothetical protein
MPKFQPGNPYGKLGGRPQGARNRLAGRVFEDIFRHWCEPAASGSEICKGQEALENLYREKPGEYLRLTASVLPKEFFVETAMADMDDEAIDALLQELHRQKAEARSGEVLN